MRVYVPTTVDQLETLRDNGFQPPVAAHAVTPALREWYVEGDQEELEYAATLAAARASLRRLRSPDVPARRVVLAADVPDAAARPAPDLDRAAVRLADPVPLSALASAHVDDASAADDVRRAVAALPLAEAGDEDAQFVLDSVEDHELAWYASQELSALVALES